jgi:hypothetical protein
MVKAGDSIPDVELTEGNPGNKVNLSKELGSGLIIGVPAAFSKLSCKLFALSFVQPQAAMLFGLIRLGPSALAA